MKKYNPTTISRMQLNGSALPRSFPGRFPTRLIWVVTRNIDEKLITDCYIGKPSMNAVRRFLSIAKHPDTFQAWVKEFDRSTVIAECFWAGPTMRINYSATSPQLIQYYHPFWPADWVPGSPGRFYSNKVAGHWIYSSSPRASTVEIDTHTNWLRARGFPST